MPDKMGGVLNVSKGVARGHVLCCCAVVFVCFMLTCLNLYMLTSTRSVLRHLDSRLDSHPRNLQALQAGLGPGLGPGPQRQAVSLQQMQSPDEAAAAAASALLLQAQQDLQPQGLDLNDFVLLAPSDLDNAWTTQNGQLLVPFGQPEDDADGWKEMQRQLAEQTNSQQRHIESLHDKLESQYRAREELQRDQHNLLRQHHELSREHQRQMAKKDRQLLKEKERVLKKGAAHQDQLRRVQSEVEELKKVVEAVQSLDPEQTTTAAAAPSSPAATPASAAADEVAQQPEQLIPDASTETVVVEVGPDGVERNPLDHIFSAVFGPNPGAFFFPSYAAGAEQAEKAEQEQGVGGVEPERASRARRDLAADREERRQKRLSRLASLRGRGLAGNRRRRHNQDETGPVMRIDEGQFVPLSPLNTDVVASAEDGGVRHRRLAGHRRHG